MTRLRSGVSGWSLTTRGTWFMATQRRDGVSSRVDVVRAPVPGRLFERRGMPEVQTASLLCRHRLLPKRVSVVWLDAKMAEAERK